MAGLDWITRSPPLPLAPVVSPIVGASPLPLDEIVERADRALPGGEVTYLTLPQEPGSPVVVRVKLPEELHPNGRNFVYLHLDPDQGTVVHGENALTAPAGTRAYNVLYPLHIGRWGGSLSRVLYSLLGLLPLVLFVSGVLMWRNRTRGRSRKRRHGRPPPRAMAPACRSRAASGHLQRHRGNERMNHRLVRAIGALSLLSTAACARTGEADTPSPREVRVTLSEFAFATSDSVFEAGVPYRFVLVNEGAAAHEWAVVPRGDADEGNLLFEVEEEDLPAGGTHTAEFTFPEAGEYDFACYMPGHYDGGMVLPVRVR